MIVLVDLLAGPTEVSLEQGWDRTKIVVQARGARTKWELDDALTSVGAGCVPDHHAEVRVDWVHRQLGPVEKGFLAASAEKWLRDVDEAREWVAAPIHWEEESPRSLAGCAEEDLPATRAHG